MVLIGAGLKFPTGKHDIYDQNLYDYDHGKNITGEYDKSAGIVPNEFQLGSGTLDLMAGFYYMVPVYNCPVFLSATYIHALGENSYGYEKKDRYAYSLGTKISVSEEPALFVNTGFSGIWIIGEDVNHAEDVSLLGSQEIGRVEDTAGVYLYLDAGLSWKLDDSYSLSLTTKWPLISGGKSTQHSMDYQFSLGLTVNF